MGFACKELKPKKTAGFRSDSPEPLVHWWVSRKPWTNSNDRSAEFMCQEIQQLARICFLIPRLRCVQRRNPLLNSSSTWVFSPQVPSFHAGTRPTQSAVFFASFRLICPPCLQYASFSSTPPRANPSRRMPAKAKRCSPSPAIPASSRSVIFVPTPYFIS